MLGNTPGVDDDPDGVEGRPAAAAVRALLTAAAAVSPERAAPSIQPFQTAEMSEQAQWIRPMGRSRALP